MPPVGPAKSNAKNKEAKEEDKTEWSHLNAFCARNLWWFFRHFLHVGIAKDQLEFLWLVKINNARLS
jgi:hypothetical protein